MLEFRDFSIERAGRVITQSLSLQLPRAGCLVVTGKNASGKSTVMSCLRTELNPFSGQVLIDGHDLHTLSNRDRRLFLRSTGIVLQTPSRLYGDVASSLRSDALPEQWVGKLQLDPSMRIRDLSTTQQRELELLHSISAKPSLLLWDEPFLSFDEDAKQTFQSLLQELQKEEVTIIVATVDPKPYGMLSPLIVQL